MRVSYFYGADIERLNFQNIKRRVFNRINQAVSYQTNGIVDNLVTAKDIRKLDIDSPLATVMGNYFKVLHKKLYFC